MSIVIPAIKGEEASYKFSNPNVVKHLFVAIPANDNAVLWTPQLNYRIYLCDLLFTATVAGAYEVYHGAGVWLRFNVDADKTLHLHFGYPGISCRNKNEALAVLNASGSNATVKVVAIGYEIYGSGGNLA